VKKLRVVWVLLAVLFLSGLGGGAALAASADATASSSDESFGVWANRGWQGGAQPVYIPQGHRVWVQPSGTWSNGSGLQVGAQGYTASQSKGFMPYCKYPRTPNLPFGRLIAMTRASSTDFKIWDAGYARWIYGPGYLYFRMNERDGACLENNYSELGVDIYVR
jgi:hypothetical protein